MASPFPGVDPYLEGLHLWPDFHSTFIVCWREALLDVLPADYDARIGERFYLSDLSRRRTKQHHPKVAPIFEDSLSSPRGRGTAVSTLEPINVPHVLDAENCNPCIEILHRADQMVVALLNLLSPSDKEFPETAVYLNKRNHVLRQNVHLVELDLLLGGRRLPYGKPLPPGDFFAFLSRAEERFDCDVYVWRLRDKLPKLPIPLLAPDPDVIVDFAAVFAETYRRGRYERAIAYDRPLNLNLRTEDRTWAAQLLSTPLG